MLHSSWTPRTLVARTFAVLRERPYLTVPVLVADLMSFAALRLQKALIRPMWMILFSHRESVLGSARTAFTLTPADIGKLKVIAIPLLWGYYFFSIYLYGAALQSTSALIQADDLRSFVAVILNSIRENSGRLFRFALSLWLLLIPAAIASGLLISLLAKSWVFAYSPTGTGYAIGLFVEMLMALVVTPLALKVLRPADDAAAPRSTARLAIVTAFATLAAQMALVVLFEYAPAVLSALFARPTAGGVLLRDGVLSLIGTIPRFPLRRALTSGR